MSEAKLRFDAKNGTLEVEGSEAFVSRMYEDFKTAVGGALTLSEQLGASPNDEREESPDATTPRRRPRRGRAPTTPDANASDKVKNYAPGLDASLDTVGLDEFYFPFAPKNHAERILIFVKFLEDKKGILPCTGDQIFTCYRSLREKIPEAFVQALRDAAGDRYGYIEYKSPTEISSTVRGTNHFEQNGISLKAAKENIQEGK
jgi:hypothetical protein